MNKILFVFLLIPLAVAGQDVDKIKQLHESYCKAVEQKDSVFLKKLFHDEMVITSGNGTKRNKKEEIGDALDPNYKVNYFKSRNVDVRVFSSTAIVTGELFWEFVYNGQTSVVERSFTFTYTKIGRDWKIVSQHIGRAAPRNP